MRSVPALIVALACTAFFALQFSGLHLHAGTVDHGMDLHAAIVPTHDAAGHGHGHADAHEHSASAQLDVSLLDAAGLTDGQFKLSFIAALLFILLAPGTAAGGRPPAPREIGGRSRRSRWRPPSRAPPVTP